MKADKDVQHLQAQDHQELLAAGREAGSDAPSEPPEGTNPADTSILDLWAPQL